MKIIKKVLFFISLITVTCELVYAAEQFGMYHQIPSDVQIQFKTSNGELFLVPASHPLFHKANQQILEEKNIKFTVMPESNIVQIETIFPIQFLKKIFDIEPASPNAIMTEAFIAQMKTGNQKIKILPRALNELFTIFNLQRPVRALSDMPSLNNNLPLQYIALLFTNQQWKPGYNPDELRKSKIGYYLAPLKEKYSNDKDAYQAAMQPVKQALYNTLHYLTDLDTQTVDSLELAKKIVLSNELNDYFYLGGATLIDYMLANLQTNNKNANATHLNKFEQYLQGLLQVPAK